MFRPPPPSTLYDYPFSIFNYCTCISLYNYFICFYSDCDTLPLSLSIPVYFPLKSPLFFLHLISGSDFWDIYNNCKVISFYTYIILLYFYIFAGSPLVFPFPAVPVGRTVEMLLFV